MKSIILATFLVIGSALCQEDILQNLPDISNLPNIPNLSDINVNDIEPAAIENYTKDALSMLKQKCANVSGGDEVYKELEDKAKSLQEFVKDSINMTVVMSELEEAKKTGSMDEVFAKYCAKKPDAMSRLRDITETFKKCLVPEDQKSIDMKLNLTEKMVHFLCEKDGDKIAMFIANGGEECLQSKFEGLQGCMNKSSGFLPAGNSQTLSLIQFDEKVCEEFPVLEECVVNVLEECKVKTPANIIGALFRYLRKNMECAPQKESVVAPDGRTLNAYLVALNRVKRRDDMNMRQAVQMRLQTKCNKNAASPDALANLNYSFQEFSKAVKSNVFEKHGNCVTLKRETELKMDIFLFNLKTCLSPKEDFVERFFRDAFDGVFNYFCENDGQKLKQFRNSKGLQCIFNSDYSGLSNCTKPIRTHSTDGGEVILQQNEFCSDITHIRKCIKKEILSQCGQDEQFKDISKDLLKIIDDKCASCTIFVNVFLMFALILFHVKEYLF
ncbi:hypothetical protein Trydic_g18036 [Trypoxylus dichotomus]